LILTSLKSFFGIGGKNVNLLIFLFKSDNIIFLQCAEVFNYNHRGISKEDTADLVGHEYRHTHQLLILTVVLTQMNTNAAFKEQQDTSKVIQSSSHCSLPKESTLSEGK
jgi:hypothetical protein